MDLYTIDVETFYSKEFSLSKMTTEEYVRSPEFELIGLSIKKNGKSTKWLTGDIMEIYAALHTIDWSNAAILCHNTLFDGAVLGWHLGLKPKLWLDTLSMSRAVFGPDARHSLAALAKHYKLPDKGDEVVRAMGMRRADFSPRQMRDYADYCIHDTDLCYQIFHLLHGEIPGGFPKKELQLIDMTIRMFTEPRLQLNKPKLQTHLTETVTRKQKLIDRVQVDKKSLMSNPKFAELLEAEGVIPPLKISPTTGKEAYAFAKTDAGLMALAEHECPEVQALVAARLGNKSTLEETRTERFMGIADRGLFPIPLRYYGAHTGRWSGQDKVNLQNLPSRGKDNKIKGAIEAPPGFVLVEADSSQIEVRVVAWLAGQADLTQSFRDKEDVYKKMSTVLYNVGLDEVDHFQRQVGKAVILGCGYGMGAERFRDTTRHMGIDLSESECQRLVKIYRDTHPNITRMWRDAGAMLAGLTRGDSINFGRQGVLEVDADRKGVRLPNGLYVQYPELSAQQTDRGFDYTYKGRGTQRKRIYGPAVVENVVQALARIIVGEQMLLINKEYPVALTVHDSAMTLVPEDEAEVAKDYVEQCMRWVPKWAKGLPVDCEAGIGRNYGEIK